MSGNWGGIARQYRLRHGLTQQRLAEMLAISQRTVSRWERGEDSPSLTQQRVLRELTREPDSRLSARLFHSVANCPMQRALSRMRGITLQALSRPALLKRPSVAQWIGPDHAPDRDGRARRNAGEPRPAARHRARRDRLPARHHAQRSAHGEHARIGTFETTVTYFLHDGTLYSDAISAPAAPDARCCYEAIAVDEMLGR